MDQGEKSVAYVLAYIPQKQEAARVHTTFQSIATEQNNKHQETEQWQRQSQICGFFFSF